MSNCQLAQGLRSVFFPPRIFLRPCEVVPLCADFHFGRVFCAGQPLGGSGGSRLGLCTEDLLVIGEVPSQVSMILGEGFGRNCWIVRIPMKGIIKLSWTFSVTYSLSPLGASSQICASRALFRGTGANWDSSIFGYCGAFSLLISSVAWKHVDMQNERKYPQNERKYPQHERKYPQHERKSESCKHVTIAICKKPMYVHETSVLGRTSTFSIIGRK